ncbi:MAG: class I SAM-dependent methyltransferase [Sulfuricaulis sp.]
MDKLSDPPISEQQKFWETWNAKMRDPEHLNDWCTKRADVIFRFFRSLRLENPEILDFGCGTGWLSEMLAKFGRVTGVDLAESAIATAKSRCPEGRFIAGDLFKIALPMNHYDVVVSQEVIAHVPDQPAYLERIANALKLGGHLIITTPNKFVIDRSDVFPPQPPEHLEKWLTIRDLKNLLRPRFKVLRTTSILPMGNRGVLRIANSTKIARLLSLFVSSDRIASLKEQLGLGYTMILLVQKKA